MKSNGIAHFFRHINKIFFVGCRQNQGPDAGPVGAEDFLFDAAHGQHLTAQGDLPVMARFFLIRRLVNSDTSAVSMVTPAEGPSLGIAPAGTWIWIS